MREYLGVNSNEEDATAEIVKNVYENALPLFRRTIESGRVRISFLDFHQFNVTACHQLENPSVVFLNVNYWRDDGGFVKEDSDTVLLHQPGTTLCYPLTDLKSLREFAKVGNLWPQDQHPMIVNPVEGACQGMPTLWKNWLGDPQQWQGKMKKDVKPTMDITREENSVHHQQQSKEILNNVFPKICEDGRGPIGHGTFSLRSRKWMIQAIEVCPHVSYSGTSSSSCTVFDLTIGHDLHFGTILEGIHAPMPLAFEASLFSTEIFWPDDIWLLHGYPEKVLKEKIPFITPGRPTIRIDDEEFTIPNAIVQPWLFHLHTKQLENACPFLPYTLPTNFDDALDTRYD